MRGAKPAGVEVTDQERAGLVRLARRRTTPRRLAMRARIVLAAAEGANNAQIARRLGVNVNVARTWRMRWMRSRAASADRPPEERLADAPRAGRPARIDDAQRRRIDALIRERPAVGDGLRARWTGRTLAAEVVRRGILPGLSPCHAARMLARARGGATSTAGRARRATTGRRVGTKRPGGRRPGNEIAAPGAPRHYTPRELIALARARAGVVVSARQVQEWHRAGFLPRPIRAKLPGQGRGRAPYRYPEPAPEAVAWLATHRRAIAGEDAVRLWLWVEGFDYVTVDPDAIFAARALALWRGVQRNLPRLPDLAIAAERDVTADEPDALLDELDRNVTTPLYEAGRLSEWELPRITFGATFLGFVPIFHPEDTRDGDVTRAEMFLDADALLDGEEADMREALREMLPTLLGLSRLTDVYRCAVRRAFDPRLVRFAWRTIVEQEAKVARVGPQLARRREALMRSLRYDPLVFAQQTLLASRMQLAPMAAVYADWVRHVRERLRDTTLPESERVVAERALARVEARAHPLGWSELDAILRRLLEAAERDAPGEDGGDPPEP
jgi:putative transposase